MAAGGGLARPEPTGYGHTDSETAYRGDTSIGGLRTHPNEEPYEFKNWGEAWDESHKETGRKRKPANDIERLEPVPEWPTRTEASMSWKEALFGDKMTSADLDQAPNGVFSYRGEPVAIQHENMIAVLERPLAPLIDAVRELVTSSEAEGIRVERVNPDILARFIKTIGDIKSKPKPTKPEGGPMTGIAKTRRTRTAKANGPSAAHKKIINELLEREDAKPTGDAVRLAESRPRREFSRYQIPTDRGLKDIEIWGDMVKVRSESTYGFGKKADDMDGLPDRIAPEDGPGAPLEMGVGIPEEMPEGMPEGAPEGMSEEGDMPEGIPLCISVSVSSPEGMEEEEAISVLDEVLRDPDISEMINERLSDSGLSLTIVAIDLDEDDDEMDEMDEMDDEYEDMADEVVDPGEGDVQEGCGY